MKKIYFHHCKDELSYIDNDLNIEKLNFKYPKIFSSSDQLEDMPKKLTTHY